MGATHVSIPSAPQVEAQDSTSEAELAQLLHRVAASDRAAFVLLYDAMSSEVRMGVQRALSDVQAVEVVVAATFLQVWWLAPLYGRHEAGVRAWIGGIMAGRVADRRSNAVFAPSNDNVLRTARLPWSRLSTAYDETITSVLAGLLGRSRPRGPY